MWYFTWILGIGVALGFGIINVMWLEAGGKFARDPQRIDSSGTLPPTREDASS
ncbi:cytochrome bd-I oxidase subunit CydX [Paraburkholderia xenovorans]|uniref:cytochrome bd-I oxidase subunit CydX n=1 Tax=Paraburkholderia xenovorans TaxID=36873 RepID=UPI0038BC9334